MKSRKQLKRLRRKQKKQTRKGGYRQYLSNVGWSTGYQTLPTTNLRGYDSALASPGMMARTTTNWV
jgi:hypothetical protein